MARGDSISRLVDRLELGFNELGIDAFGISKRHLVAGFTALGWLYRNYFRVTTVGTEHIPPRGRAMLVGNHSGGYAIDGAMVLTSTLLELDPPRLAQGMAERFINQLPLSSSWSFRTGQFTGSPENAERLLEAERLLMVFPEGARGTAKLHRERHTLVDFGTGFLRLALKTKTPIIPFGFAGGADAVPTVYNSKTLGRLLGVPYVPFTPYGLPLPLPAKCELHYGAPMRFEGTGDEDDAVIRGLVDEVKARIATLMAEASAARGSPL